MPAAKVAAPAPVKLPHVGRCLQVPGCRRRCEAYRESRPIDTYATCVCGHTQQIHAPAEPVTDDA